MPHARAPSPQIPPGPCPDPRWRRQRPVTCRRAGRLALSSRLAAARQHGAGGAGALPQPGQGQRPPLPPEGAARRAALPRRALRLRPQQGAAGQRVRALPAQVPGEGAAPPPAPPLPPGRGRERDGDGDTDTDTDGDTDGDTCSGEEPAVLGSAAVCCQG